MAVRTRRLGAGSTLLAATVPVFLVPVDRTAIVKSLTVFNGAAAIAAHHWFVTIAVTGVTYSLRRRTDLGPSQVDDNEGRFDVLHEGDLLSVQLGGAANYQASGSLLAGDPA